MEKAKNKNKESKTKAKTKPTTTKVEKTTTPKPKQKKKKISNFYKLVLLVAGIITFIVCYCLFGTLIAAAAVLAYTVLVLITMILDTNPKDSKKRKIFKVFMIFCLTVGIIGICAFIGFFTYIAIKAPELDVSKLEQTETSILYDNKNQIITSLGSEKRENITYDELPEVLVDAIVATEDSRFFQHNGFDAARFLKASLGQLAGSSGAGGASTLTMQISKKTLSSEDVSITRKFTDIYLSIFKLEKAFTKEEIFEYYVNIPFLGSNSSGVEQASLTYFGKHAYELSLAEASIIAGLFQAPSEYDPYVNPENAAERQDTVLNLMVNHGYITKEEKEIVQQIKVTDLLLKDENESSNEYQSYIDMVVKELSDKFGINPYEVPILVYTNMDRTKQEGIYDVFTGKTYDWPNKTIQGGVAAIESRTGKIIAIGGGRNRTGAMQLNYATDIKKQIGSTAKPLFDYAPGIEYNNWSTAQTFNDVPYTYSNGAKMTNYDSAYKGKITLRYSLRDSRNVPALQAFQKVDNAKIKQFVTSLGLTPEIDSTGYLHEAHSIGAFNGASPLQLAAAYAAFSNGGYYYEPYTINKIVFRNSNDEITNESEKVKVMSDSTAYMITDILKGVAQDIGITSIVSGQIAAKTGTTNYDDATLRAMNYPSNATPDGWIAGYTPEIAMAMWTGFDENKKGVYLTQSQMVRQRNGLYRACAKVVMKGQTKNFTKPSSVIAVTVEAGTNPIMLPSANTPKNKQITELFKRGTEPTEISITYRTLDNPRNLTGTPTNGGVTLNWDSVPLPSDLENNNYGNYGYKIYLNGKYLGFTTKTTYFHASSSQTGEYTVKTGFENSNQHLSSGVSITLRQTIDIIYNESNEVTIKVGDGYTELDKPITVTLNGEDVTNEATISRSIFDVTNNQTVTEINTTVAGEYQITFTVTYKNSTKSFTKVVKIID